MLCCLPKPLANESMFLLTYFNACGALAAGVQLRPRPPDTYAALLRELSAIGNNVNQIAYWANATKGIGKAEIAEAAALVRQAWRMVKETL